jgi:hypothetical protein
MVRGIFLGKLGVLREENLQDLCSPGKRRVLIHFCQNFNGEGRTGFGSRYLHHLIDGLGCNREKGFFRRRYYGSLIWEVVCLAFEGKFWKMVDLRKKIQRDI